MDIRITPHPLNGSISAIASKSDAHRCLIAAALADSPTKLDYNTTSEDIEATITALDLLMGDSETVDCGESGSTLRFLIPIAACLDTKKIFVGHGRLPERPLSDLLKCLRDNGAKIEGDKLPLTITGGLRSGEFILPGNVSSQYITGLLFVLPLLIGDSTIRLTTPLESKGYVDMTIDVLKKFGIKISETADGYNIEGGQKYISPGEIKIEGDWSNAAFFLAANALGGDVEVTNLDMDSTQRDKKIINLIKDFKSEISIDETPDLLPILSIIAAHQKETTVFTNAARLKLKESDRLESTKAMLKSFGIDSDVSDDKMSVTGGQLQGGIVETFNDHRIAMAAGIAACYATGETIIKDAECVNKSYPEFFTDLEKLGGICYVINDR